MTVLGEGAYGCVHKPSLKCKDRPDISYVGKLSKIMTKQHAAIELKEYNVVDSVDKNKDFYLGKPDECDPVIDTDTIKEVDKCKWVKSKDIKKMKLLIMQDGGLDLSNYIDTINTKTKEDVERFLIEAHRVILGINVLGENGVIHHDLKPQNIVYNEVEHRINFIDFGHMTQYEILKNRSIQSRNTHAVEHWSFPLEMMFLNKRNYNEYANRTIEERRILFPRVWAHIKEHVEVLMSYINYKTDKKTALETYAYIKRDYYDMFVNDFTPGYYNEFLEKSLKTIDVYGLGMSFMHILGSFKHFIGNTNFSKFYGLAMYAVSSRVNARCDADFFLKTYESILDESGILAKYGLHIKDHKIVEISKELPIADDDEVKKSINVNRILKPCSDVGKEHNPITGRCVKPCKPGTTRNAKFRCTRKSVGCPENKELNPNTGRCVVKCNSGYMRNERFRCTRKSTTVS
jgi:serine/threonine protein kinase